jgi:hypothetical protein
MNMNGRRLVSSKEHDVSKRPALSPEIVSRLRELLQLESAHMAEVPPQRTEKQ